jgi:uncharacterized membrane protein YdjX (TVP38/TMEM64 family)
MSKVLNFLRLIAAGILLVAICAVIQFVIDKGFSALMSFIYSNPLIGFPLFVCILIIGLGMAAD